MATFRITYTDPETGDRLTVTEVFHSTKNIQAREWAEDLAYTLSDKNTDYEIEEMDGR